MKARHKNSYYLALLGVLAVYQAVTILRSTYENDMSRIQGKNQDFPTIHMIDPSETKKLTTTDVKRQPAWHPSSQRQSPTRLPNVTSEVDEKTNNKDLSRGEKIREKNATSTREPNDRVLKTMGNATTVRRKPAWSKRGQIVCPEPSPILDYIQVAPPPANPKKILCFFMTKSEYHKTRALGAARTWGMKCDKLLILSDEEDLEFGSIRLQSNASYEGLWNKLNETVHYLHEPQVDNNYAAYIDQYDWFLKADDDSYVIMENLQHFLNQPEIERKHRAGEPLIYGRRYSWCRAEQLRSRRRPFRYYFNATGSTQQNHRFEKHFYQKFHDNPPVLYNHGGAGYVMNRSYMRQFLKALDSPYSLSGLVDEDLAHGATMAYHGIFPQPTVDDTGGQYFLPEAPSYMYSKPLNLLRRLVGDNIPSEVVRNGTDCCARYTISFHHISLYNMLNYHRLFYLCREPKSAEP